jgi:hypothetical protein
MLSKLVVTISGSRENACLLIAQEHPRGRTAARGTIRHPCRLNIALLAAAVFLGTLLPVQSEAVSRKKQCIKTTCKRERRLCINDFRQLLVVRRSQCVAPSGSVGKRCARKERNSFGRNRKKCKDAFRDCARCCRKKRSECHVTVDSDGDGLLDIQELRGWTCRVTAADGQTHTLQVTSDPDVADTDGDGLSDYVEHMIRTDAASQDTDGDGLTDGDEVAGFYTNANIADSDGDGFTDPEELFELNRDPRIADLPETRISIGEMRLQLDERFTYADEDGQLRVEHSTTDTTLTRGSTSTNGGQGGTTKTQGTVGKWLVRGGLSDQETLSFTIFGSKVTIPLPFVQAEGGQDIYNLTDEYNLTTWENQKSAEEAYQQSREKGQQFSTSSAVTREVAAGRVDVAVTLENAGEVAFALSNVEITALTTHPEDRTRLVPMATLLSSSTLLTGQPAVYHLGPLERSRGPVVFSNSEIYPLMVEDLMRDPRGVLFEVANYDVTDESGRNFAFGSQVANDRTAGISVDFGDGTLRRHRVIVAAVQREDGSIEGGFDENGKPRGVSMDHLLSKLLQLPKNGTDFDAILAGEGGVVDTIAEGDDVQRIPAGTVGVPPDAIAIAAGENGVLDTAATCDDGAPCAARGDCTGIGDGMCKGRGDDVADVVTGYETSKTCNPQTPARILPGDDGELDTTVPSASQPKCVITVGQGHSYGESCSEHTDCGEEGEGEDRRTGYCRGDVERPDLNEIWPGPDGFIDSIRRGDDLLVAPGFPCTADQECQVDGAGGACDGPEIVVRVENRRSGDFRRFWALLLPDDSQFQTDFSKIRVRPGDALALAFIEDRDRDGLIAPVEAIYGSSDTRDDTDDDGLDDFAEIRVGWTVGVAGQPLRKVFPDPAQPDSDGDGLLDREEMNVTELLDVFCDSGTDGADVDPISFCPDDRLPTDPRRRDTDDDRVTDLEEVLGFLTGAGIVDPAGRAGVVLIAGGNRRANTQACPERKCRDDAGTETDPTMFCRVEHDCPTGFFCENPNDCDDIQIAPAGAVGLDPRTVVVLPGPDGALQTPATGDDEPAQTEHACIGGHEHGAVCSVSEDSWPRCEQETCVGGAKDGEACSVDEDCWPRCEQATCAGGVKDGESCESDDDCAESSCGAVASTSAIADDVPVAGPGDPVSDQQGCLDRSGFPMCAVVKPGPDGILQSAPAGDDVLAFGQRLEATDPTDPDTDLDQVQDGIERDLGSSPNNPEDTGVWLDTDLDGLTDNQERLLGWQVELVECDCGPAGCPKATVYPNPYAPDTDLDGLPDYLEYLIKTDPTSEDTDADGLTDYDELSADEFDAYARFNDYFGGFHLDGTGSAKYGTDPSSADTDCDGRSDYQELFVGWMVQLPASGVTRRVFSDPTQWDTDGDGLNDYWEEANRTDPDNPDTDADGQLDGVECEEAQCISNPNVPDRFVTVKYHTLELLQAGEDWGSETPLGWDFRLQKPFGNFPGATVVGTGWNFLAEQCEAEGGEPCLDTCQIPAGSMLQMRGAEEYFALRDGHSFVLSGEVNTYDQDCSAPPKCHFTFFQAYEYSNLRDGIQVVTFEGQVTGGAPTSGGELEMCQFRVVAAITVGTRPPVDSDDDGLTDEEEQVGWSSFANLQEPPIGCGICIRGRSVGRRCQNDTQCRASSELEEGACQTGAGLARYTSDPNEPDTDGDLLPDFVEYTLGTNPREEDTDCDGLEDIKEAGVGAWLAENSAQCPGYRQLTRGEIDAIRRDCEEHFNCWFVAGGSDTSPTVWDTDCDGEADLDDDRQEQLVIVYPEWFFTGENTCPWVWKQNPSNGHWYALSSRGSWEAAQWEARSLGGNLATIRNEDENDWIVENFVRREEPFCPRDHRIGPWIGLTDRGACRDVGPTRTSCTNDLDCELGHVCVEGSCPNGPTTTTTTTVSPTTTTTPGPITTTTTTPVSTTTTTTAGCCVQYTCEALYGWVSGEPCAKEAVGTSCDSDDDCFFDSIWYEGRCEEGSCVKNYTACPEYLLKGHDVSEDDALTGYENCWGNEPNNCCGGEDWFHFWDPSLKANWGWNDLGPGTVCRNLPGIIEVENLPNWAPGPFFFSTAVTVGEEPQRALMASEEICPVVCGPGEACKGACTSASCPEPFDPACHHCSIGVNANVEFPANDPSVRLEVRKEFRDELLITTELSGWGIDNSTLQPQRCEERTAVISTVNLKGKLGRYSPVFVPPDASSSVWTFDVEYGGDGSACENCCLADDTFVFGVEACPPTPENLVSGCE